VCVCMCDCVYSCVCCVCVMYVCVLVAHIQRGAQGPGQHHGASVCVFTCDLVYS